MESLNLIKNDPWLAPYKEAIEGRYQYVIDKEKSLTNNGKQTLAEMASGYLYFGLHKTNKGWVFREWAPNATAIYLIGTFNDWKKDERYKMRRLGYGVWEIALEEELLRHEDLFKLLVEWDGGSGERIPAWIRRVVQDEQTKIFSAQVWNPVKPYALNFAATCYPALPAKDTTRYRSWRYRSILTTARSVITSAASSPPRPVSVRPKS